MAIRFNFTDFPDDTPNANSCSSAVSLFKTKLEQYMPSVTCGLIEDSTLAEPGSTMVRRVYQLLQSSVDIGRIIQDGKASPPFVELRINTARVKVADGRNLELHFGNAAHDCKGVETASPDMEY